MQIKSGLWGLVGGIVLTAIVGFGFMGWTLSSTAERQTEEAVDDALTELRADICAAQARATQGAVEELEAVERSYNRRDRVQEQSWSKVPGQEEEVSRMIADRCAEKLLES